MPRRSNQIGTLLLDSLTAIAILAIVFAVSFPNYNRARFEADVAIDIQQMDAISTATQLYGNEHQYTYPTGTVSGTNPGAAYLPGNPVSPLGDTYAYGTVLSNGALYVIVDQVAFTTAAAGSGHDITLLNNYKQANGTSVCATGNFMAYDTVHGAFCATTSGG
jgi:type II secretory pathway pseudopilin PulG